MAWRDLGQFLPTFPGMCLAFSHGGTGTDTTSLDRVAWNRHESHDNP